MRPIRRTLAHAPPSSTLVLAGLALLLTAAGVQASQAEAAAQEPITDAQIAGVVLSAAATDISQAELALRKASDPKVRQFAEAMVADQTAMDQRTLAVMAALGVSPAESAASQRLTDESRATIDELAVAGRPQFDRAYLEAEVAEHRRLLDQLDELLSPAADHPQLRALLAGVRPIIQTHLEDAQELASELAG